MRKALTLLFVFAFVLMNIGLLLSQQNAEDEKLQKIVNSYFDDLWKFYPTTATVAGYHKYDDKLEDLSSKNIDKHHDALDSFNQEFKTKIDKMKLSPERQIDLELMVNAIDLELLKHENLLPWEYNPLFYNHLFINCIRSLLTGEFAPLESRAKNASERMKDLPKLIKQAKENLKTPAQLYTEKAIKQFPAVLNFYKSELPALLEQVPSDYKSKIQSNLAKVIPALEDYQNFLQNVILPRSQGNFRLLEAHTRLWRGTFNNNLTIDDLLARQKADVYNIRRDMFLICISFYKIMDPKFDVEHPPANLTEDQVKNAVISHVLDKIKTDHVTKEEFLNKIITLAGEIKDFILKNQVIELPEEELKIVPMPLESQGLTWTHLISPSVYETSTTYTCQIAPLSDSFTEAEIQSLLEEYNNYFLPFYVMRKVYPGQFVPLYLANKNTSLIKKLYPNQPLVKAWPILVEEMLIHNGLGNYDLRLRLNQLKYRLKTAIDFILEFNIHEGGMTMEDAIAYMMRVGFQTEAEARRNWNRIILNPGDSAYAYVGLQDLLDMEKEYKQLKGETFSQKEFLNKVLSYGPISLRHLKKKILE